MFETVFCGDQIVVETRHEMDGDVYQVVVRHVVDLLQYVAVCCSVVRCVAVCCSVLQCVAVCCSVLQCVQ